MAYPMIPVVSPDKITIRFPRAAATTGTKGGEQMAEAEVIINVSVSILKILQKIPWRVREPNTENPT